MSDVSQGQGWWIASDNKWYPPEQHPDYVAPTAAPVVPETPSYAAETVAIPAADSPAATTPPIVPAHASPPGPSFEAPGAATQTYNPGQSIDPVYNLPAGDAPAQSRRSLILGIGALVLVAGLGFLAFRFVTGGSAGTGAASPEAAVQQLVTSINERDAVGVIEVFDPDEIEAWVGSFTSTFDSFDQLDAQGEAENELTEAYERLFESFDYSLTGPDGAALEFDVEPLDNNGRISRVRVNGLDFSVSVPNAADTSLIVSSNGSQPTGVDLSVIDGAQLELRDSPRGLIARLMAPGENPVNEEVPDAHIDVVTVQKDGEWYISIGYSFLEIARNQPDAFPGRAQPQFGRGYELVENQTGGAESPDGAVREFFTAFETLDYNAMIELTDPLGTPYLHDYQPLIDEQVDDRDRRDAALELGLVLDELELGVSEWEGRTLVTIGSISGRVAEGSFEFDATTFCGSATTDGDTVEGCLVDGIQELLFEIDNDSDPRDFLPEAVGMIVTERNGRWYVDPLATAGFYTSQISEAAGQLAGALNGNAMTEFGQLIVAEGPISRQGAPATATAVSGTAAVALDLQDYPQVGNAFDQSHVALARVTTNAPGTYVSNQDVPLGGIDWFVAHDRDLDDGEFASIVALTDGTLGVELFDVQVTEVGVDGFTGQLGGEGRPQVITFTDEATESEISFTGVNPIGVSRWDSNGVVVEPDPFAFSSFSSDVFVIIEGEPGATFSVDVASFGESATDPSDFSDDSSDSDLDSGIADSPDLGDFRANSFLLFVEPYGYEYFSEQSGGYFDGCGPSDPDVTSYLFGESDNDRLVVTPYPSVARAEAALAALLTVQSPCDDFDDLVVLEVEQRSDDVVRISWEFEGDASPTIEHYRLAGDTIVVAVNNNLTELENQLTFLDGF